MVPYWTMVRRSRRPRLRLSAIKQAFADPSSLSLTLSAQEGAFELGLNNVGIVEVIGALRERDFDHSETARHDDDQWMDVYLPRIWGMSCS